MFRGWILLVVVCFTVLICSESRADLTIIHHDAAGSVEVRPSESRQNHEDAVQELQNQRAQFATQVNQLGTLSAATPSFSIQDQIKNFPAMGLIVEKLGSFAESRFFKKAMAWVQTAAFQQLVMEIAKNPKLSFLYWVQVGWALILILLGAVWRARGTGFFRALGIRMVMLVLFWAGSLGVIPTVLLGSPYLELIKQGYLNLI